MELARNGAKYEKISSFSGSVTNTDGSVIEFGNSPNGSKAIERQGMKQFDKVRNKIKGIDRAIDNYFVCGRESYVLCADKYLCLTVVHCLSSVDKCCGRCLRRLACRSVCFSCMLFVFLLTITPPPLKGK